MDDKDKRIAELEARLAAAMEALNAAADIEDAEGFDAGDALLTVADNLKSTLSGTTALAVVDLPDKGNECTARPVFLVQRRFINAVREPDGYSHDGEGFIEDDGGEDAEYLTGEQLLAMECAVEQWETVAVAFSREDAEAYGKDTAHRYREGWRSYGVPAIGGLAEIVDGRGAKRVVVLR